MLISKPNFSSKPNTTLSTHIFSNSQLDIPFFFNGRSGTFYRFESSIYNFSEDPLLKNFVLT